MKSCIPYMLWNQLIGSTNYAQIDIFFFILITHLVDIVLILYGEILSWSLMEVKGLKEGYLLRNY